QAFQHVWEGIQELVKGTSCEGYVNGYLYDIRKRWARCFFPTTMTLGMTASQRVEGTFSAIKNRRCVKRNSTFRYVRQRCDTVAADLALASRMQSTEAPSFGIGRVETDIKKSLEPVLKAYDNAQASKYAKEEIMAEMLATAAYETSTLAEGFASSQFLKDLAARSTGNFHDSVDGDGDIDVGGDDLCCQVPEEVFQDGQAPDIAMFGTTSLASFCQLLEGVQIDSVVKVLYKHKPDRKVGHLVVVGPGGFQLCTCLQLMRRGLQCRHVLAALVTELNRGGEFLGASIHPRWRMSTEPWSLEKAGLSEFDENGSRSYEGGCTGDWHGPDDVGDFKGEDAPDPTLSVMRGRAYANMMEVCNRAVRKFVDNMTKDTREVDQSMFGELSRSVDAWARRED
ncbi:unnamed protein product, partial [Scytosiphon promiscuus]